MVPPGLNDADQTMGWEEVVLTRTSAQKPEPQSLVTVRVNDAAPGAGGAGVEVGVCE
jgi:hypothetical protein